MDSLLLTAFLLGFFASPHCLGMCGPLITAYSLSKRDIKKYWFHITYNLGRMLSYTLIGALVGYFGSMFKSVLVHSHIPYLFEIIGSSILILYGLTQLVSWQTKKGLTIPIPTQWRGSIGKRIRLLSPGSIGLLGFSTGFLPCHLFLPVFALVLASASWLYGAMIMFLFFMGTLPMNLGYGVLVSFLQGSKQIRYKAVFQFLTIILSIGIGIYMFIHRGNMLSMY